MEFIIGTTIAVIFGLWMVDYHKKYDASYLTHNKEFGEVVPFMW